MEVWAGKVPSSSDSTNTDDVKSSNDGETFRHTHLHDEAVIR